MVFIVKVYKNKIPFVLVREVNAGGKMMMMAGLGEEWRGGDLRKVIAKEC